MSVYFFDTITAAQALTYNAATDVLIFGNTSSAGTTFVNWDATTVTVTDGATGRGVTFGSGMFGETDFRFVDNSHLTVGQAGSPSPPAPPYMVQIPTLPPAPGALNGASGSIGGNMDADHLNRLIGASIDSATPTILSINGPTVHLTLGGLGFVYDVNEQLVGGAAGSINYSSPVLSIAVSMPGVSAAAFGGWVLTDATQTAFATILANDDRIGGSGGADLLRGYDGNDLLFGFGGSDTIYGGNGDDFIYAATIPGFNTFSPLGPSYLRGEDGNDVIVGSAAFDDINGNKGDDTIDGGPGGNDWLVGGQGNDLIIGHTSWNIEYGNLGADTVLGGTGNDWLRGGQGDDSIVGGAGNNWISGDRGNDTEAGGAGADTFNGFSGIGIDRILDFKISDGDKIQLDPGTAWSVIQVGADAVVDLGNGDKLILVGVQVSSLTPGWIFGF